MSVASHAWYASTIVAYITVYLPLPVLHIPYIIEGVMHIHGVDSDVRSFN